MALNYNIKKLFIERKRESIKKKIQSSGICKLDLGCGPTKRYGYIGIDFSSNADIQWDLRFGIPCDDNSISIIRSDHFFEHLSIDELMDILKDCRRVLIKGGVLDFSVPHINPYISAYLENDFEFLKEKIHDIPDGKDDLFNTCFDRVVWLLHRSGEHKSMFDTESILEKVKLSGFNMVHTREYDPNKDNDPRFSSIYVVAIK